MISKRNFLPFLSAGLIAVSGSIQVASAQVGGRVDPDQLSKYGAPANSAQALKDRLFLHTAFETNSGEIEISKLAVAKSSRDDVKGLAQSVIDDETKLNAEIKPIADQLEASLPKKMSKADQAEYNKLSGLTGADFDKEYLTYQLKVHQKNLQAFNNEAEVASAPDLSTAVHDGQKIISSEISVIQKLSAATT